MDKKFREAKAFVTNTKNRKTVIATAAGVFAVVAGIITMTAKRGKAKRK